MTYAIVKVVNGSYAVAEEGIATPERAKARFHATCNTLWNAPDVITGCVMIADENLNAMEGYRETIFHEPAPEPEPEPAEAE